MTESENYARRKLECDLWTAAFFWRISAPASEMNVLAPTQSELAKLRRGEKLNPDLVRQVQALADQLRFFHWELEFPEVFEQGGFDVKLMNPPWERIKLQEEEFFAARDPGIATAPNKAARQKLIEALPKKNPALAREFEDAKHDAEATSKFVRESKRFPLTAVGDVNTYALFAEHARTLLNGNGRAGIILPTGIATDDTTSAFFGDLIEKQNLVSILGFINEEQLFPAVLHNFKFCTIIITGSAVKIEKADFAFLCFNINHARQPERHFRLSRSDFLLLNPNTRTCPIFRSGADAELARKIYQNVPVLINEEEQNNSWDVRFLTMFHMANDSGLFSTRTGVGLLPLYEGKMMYQFDHRFASYESLREQERMHMLPETSLADHQNANYTIKPCYYQQVQN